MNLNLEELMVGIPDSVANLQLPDPDLRDFYSHEQERILWLNDDVENCAENLIRHILRYNKDDKGKDIKDRQPIKIFINSNGGDVIYMWTLVNLINKSKTKIITINYSTAYSAAAVILASGHERYGMPGSHVMVHSGYCMYQGQEDQVKSTKKYFDSIQKKVKEYLLSKTNIKSSTYDKKSAIDWYMNEEDALNNGVIDKIVDDIDEIL